MNIQTHQTQQTNSVPKPYFKPVKESWQLGGDHPSVPVEQFESTSALLDSGAPLHGRKASYQAVSKLSTEMTRKDRLKQVGFGAAVMGTVGAMIAVPLGLVVGLGHSLAPGILSNPALGPSLGIVSFFTLGGALHGLTKELGDETQVVEGVLQSRDGKVTFHEEKGNQEIDLNRFKDATIPPLVNGERDYGDQWWRGGILDRTYDTPF